LQSNDALKLEKDALDFAKGLLLDVMRHMDRDCVERK
jgi:hypothetical protein